MKIVCISGKAQHGKDTTAKILEQELNAVGHSVLICHYADLIKYICTSFFGWDGNKDEIGRSLLQRVGTEVVREQDENYWVNFIADILTFFPEDWDYVIIPDFRFPNEIDVLKQRGFNACSVRVCRENFENSLIEEQRSHPSETSLDDYTPDAIIYNTTYENLTLAVKTFVSTVLNPDVPSVVHGEWFWEKICDNPPRPICSKCFDEPYRKNNVELPNYCPNCGAKMDGGSSL